MLGCKFRVPYNLGQTRHPRLILNKLPGVAGFGPTGKHDSVSKRELIKQAAGNTLRFHAHGLSFCAGALFDPLGKVGRTPRIGDRPMFRFVALPLLVAGLFATSTASTAQTMPTTPGKPVTLVVSFPSGALAAGVAFAIFEIWFLVALPKGPLETYLGY